MERRLVVVRVLEVEEYDGQEKFPFSGPLQDGIDALCKVRDSIPVESREGAKLAITSVQSYDSSQATVVVSYVRPENDEELAERKERERLHEVRTQQHELRLLKELKEKYKR